MQSISNRKHAAEILFKLPTVPDHFTIEMNDGSKYTASLADLQYIWTGFEKLPDTTLSSPAGPISIDLYDVKDIY